MPPLNPFHNSIFGQPQEPTAPEPVLCKCHQATVEADFEDSLSDKSWSPSSSRPSTPSISRNDSFEMEMENNALIEIIAPSVALTRRDSAHAIARSLWGKVPPKNFGQVIPGPYRSSFPLPENFPFLKILGLKSILTLVPDEYAESEHCFQNELGVQHFQVGIKPNKGGINISATDMTSALAVIMDTRNHPLLIHCNKGKHRTGCVVACLRKCIDWPISRVLDEYRQYAGVKARDLDIAFIGGWDDVALHQMARPLARTPRMSSLRLMPINPLPMFDILSESPIRTNKVSTRLRS
ncbi:MAG: hypothetical protein M1828_007094 [Chrysothrix sp. TS-e1954]|nr:MAG: hypothetical protein M1828_007094 [Chrysothrix sp. TS-e1954]